jgi:beta-phosphoglucomutase
MKILEKYDAFIFDMDGTLVDNMSYHEFAWIELLKKLGKNFTRETLLQQMYGKNDEVFERIFPGKFNLAEKDKMAWDKEEEYRQLYKSTQKPIDGLVKFLEILKSANKKIALSTAANDENIRFTMDGLDLRKYFDIIVGADDVTHGKPNPEVFLTAASKLNVLVEKCVVFEDMPKGAEAGYNAEMDIIMLSTSYGNEYLMTLPNVVGVIANYDVLVNF